MASLRTNVPQVLFPCFPRCIGQGHQLQNVGAVLGNFFAYGALHAAWHLLLHPVCKRQQIQTGAVNGQLGMQGHGGLK